MDFDMMLFIFGRHVTLLSITNLIKTWKNDTGMECGGRFNKVVHMTFSILWLMERS